MAIVVKNTNKTLRTAKPVYFSDFLNSFSLQPIKNDIYNITNEESVKQSVKNIIFTNKGERFFNPTFGSDINLMLFENITPATEQIISDLIKTALKNHEPRAEVIEVNVTSQPDNNSVYVNIIFSTINSSEPISLDLILDRIR